MNPPTPEQLLLVQIPKIVLQLEWIRFHLEVLIGIGVIFILLIIAFRRNVVRKTKSDFSRQGQDLLHSERYEEIVTLGAKHLTKFPGDASAEWIVAQAHSRLGNFNEALAHAKKAKQLEPWSASVLEPFIAHAQEEAKLKRNQGLKVVTPNLSPQSDAPPTGGAPLS